ncbi:uncharacterized protein Z519_12169 [Cladophialophora bantiana CBS 173.52]|uniref:Enoyl reductase (ER) domain-containing protein n=1 Tax=Cladophialophora bantiana (strain ATCC 10958 / CBS 173.52 / CDC B-1940 / NIH 8579) TaxID=1442370 RepID=A0A0D2EAU5_CLAB1|nr:uncharacterized protein Z519_12169 [Cladophialophora bantiana CBS 173.52]KIW87266.1 hypothetical protein Z519_12169 [Cladophialophora bantiana CBS 173.52]
MSRRTKVLRQTAPGTAVIEQVPIPLPGKDEVLVKVYAVALNPYDWKMLYGRVPPVPTGLGCDFAGFVETVGENVTRVQPDERVAGMVQGGNILRPDDGAFAEYIIAPAHVLLHLPESTSFEDGVTVPTPAFTAGFCLEHIMSMSVPVDGPVSTVNGQAAIKEAAREESMLLVYGGASSTGLMLVQMGKLAGMQVLAVCSKESFDLVRRYGADVVFDYRDAGCEKSLQDFTRGLVRYTVDCISDVQSAAICSRAMGAEPGTYISFTANGPEIGLPNVKSVKIVSFTVLGRVFSFRAKGPIFPVIEDDAAFGGKFADRLELLLRGGKLKPLRSEEREGGLTNIVSGLEELKAGRVRGRRLVYALQ